MEKVSPNNISLPSDLPKTVPSTKKSTKTAKVTEIPRPEAKIEPELPQVQDIPPAKIELELPQVQDIPLPEPEPLLLEMEPDNYSLL